MKISDQAPFPDLPKSQIVFARFCQKDVEFYRDLVIFPIDSAILLTVLPRSIAPTLKKNKYCLPLCLEAKLLRKAFQDAPDCHEENFPGVRLNPEDQALE